MAFLVIYVLDNVGQMPAILEAWEKAGASGITILESTGVERWRRNPASILDQSEEGLPPAIPAGRCRACFWRGSAIRFPNPPLGSVS